MLPEGVERNILEPINIANLNISANKMQINRQPGLTLRTTCTHEQCYVHERQCSRLSYMRVRGLTVLTRAHDNIGDTRACASSQPRSTNFR